MYIESRQKEIILEKLLVPPSRESLLNLISWLDIECCNSTPESLSYQLLARSVIALGYEIINKGSIRTEIKTVADTIKSGEDYLLDPTDQMWGKFSDYATKSYPFGPGDGCFDIPELGYPTCKPGSGCGSGSGTLACQLLDDVEAMRIITKELIPWIMGDDDPVISRSQRI